MCSQRTLVLIYVSRFEKCRLCRRKRGVVGVTPAAEVAMWAAAAATVAAAAAAEPEKEEEPQPAAAPKKQQLEKLTIPGAVINYCRRMGLWIVISCGANFLTAAAAKRGRKVRTAGRIVPASGRQNNG